MKGTPHRAARASIQKAKEAVLIQNKHGFYFCVTFAAQTGVQCEALLPCGV